MKHILLLILLFVVMPLSIFAQGSVPSQIWFEADLHGNLVLHNEWGGTISVNFVGQNHRIMNAQTGPVVYTTISPEFSSRACDQGESFGLYVDWGTPPGNGEGERRAQGFKTITFICDWAVNLNAANVPVSGSSRNTQSNNTEIGYVGASQPNGCSVTPSGGSFVNIRSGRGTNFSVVARLASDSYANFSNSESGWYQVGEGQFVSADVTRQIGCSSSVNEQPTTNQDVNAGNCATQIGGVTIVHSGLNGISGGTVESLRSLYNYLAENAQPAPSRGRSWTVVLQYISSLDENKAVFPSIEGNVVGTEGGARHDATNCTLHSYQNGIGEVRTVGVARNDLGHPEAVGFMAHEIAHSLGAGHGFYAWESVPDRDVSLPASQDAYYWGFLVTDAFYQCASFAPNVQDSGASVVRCNNIRLVLGI